MGFETIEYELRDGVGVLRLNRPKCLNAINRVMRDELTAFWRDHTRDAGLRVVLLCGAGRGFCAGLDITDQELTGPSTTGSPDTIYAAQRSFSEMILLMRRCPQPIVGAFQGVAVGAGLSFAMACDVRLSTPDTRFQAAYINLGLGGADMGSSYLLPRLIGTGNAARYLYTGDFIPADEAHRTGLVQQLAESEALEEQAMAIARTIASKSPLGLRVTKEALNAHAGSPGLEQALLYEDRNQALCIAQVVS
jgi:enoyl-CoA hydratase